MSEQNSRSIAYWAVRVDLHPASQPVSLSVWSSSAAAPRSSLPWDSPLRPNQPPKPGKQTPTSSAHHWDHGGRRQRHRRGLSEPAVGALQRYLVPQRDRRRRQQLGLRRRALRRRRATPDRRQPGRRCQPHHHSYHHHGSLLHRMRGGAGGQRAGHVHHCQVGARSIASVWIGSIFSPSFSKFLCVCARGSTVTCWCSVRARARVSGKRVCWYQWAETVQNAVIDGAACSAVRKNVSAARRSLPAGESRHNTYCHCS